MAYEFKVGDKGNTRDGKGEYEVIAISDNMHDAHNLIAKIRTKGGISWGITTRAMDGTTAIKRINYYSPGRDFMPPSVKVWRVTASRPTSDYIKACSPRPVPCRVVADYPDSTPARQFAELYEEWFYDVTIEQVEVEKL